MQGPGTIKMISEPSLPNTSVVSTLCTSPYTWDPYYGYLTIPRL